MSLKEIERGYWECFLKTGSVENYLRYSTLKNLNKEVYEEEIVETSLEL